MTSIVQLAGGIRASQDQYTGQPRELTVVTDAKELRLHDGTTAGGKRFLNMTQNDQRYHLVNPELTGIISLAPQEKVGIVTRSGDGTYVARELKGTAGQISVANPKGLGGDYTISLPATITPNLTFSGVITFSQNIIGNLTGDVTGNITGNVTGNVEGNVTGDVVGNLTGNAAGSHTGSFVGNVDVSSGTLVCANNQIDPAWINGSFADPAYLVPQGAILMWSGSIATIPVGWVICDGLNGTPDLTDKFVIGAGGVYSVADNGGTTNHSHAITVDSGGNHNHAITVNDHTLTADEMPVHNHGGGSSHDNSTIAVSGITAQADNSIGSGRGDTRSGSNPGYSYPTKNAGGGQGHNHTASSVAGGDHTHSGSSGVANNLPPYYALAYIMKT